MNQKPEWIGIGEPWTDSLHLVFEDGHPQVVVQVSPHHLPVTFILKTSSDCVKMANWLQQAAKYLEQSRD